ncbi:MAG: hypothetical protein JWQ94_4505 [Tardiphaga sp.]|jgi:hypothetical protein|nr:hypothetical protein [Tardiphaga sp.]
MARPGFAPAAKGPCLARLTAESRLYRFNVFTRDCERLFGILSLSSLSKDAGL